MTKIIILGIASLSLVLADLFSVVEDNTPQTTYQKFCAGCHGSELQDFRDQDWQYGDSKENIQTAIARGYEDDGMPAFEESLDAESIEALATFILAESKKPFVEQERKFESSSEIIRSDDLAFRVETVVDDLDVPWGLAFLPGDQIIITERDGDLFIYDDEDGLQSISNAPEVVARGQGGLLDVEVHPDFASNRYIYLSYSKKESNGNKATTAVMRARLENNTLKDAEDIFVALPYESTRHHYGSRLEFDVDGYLYISVGDRGRRDKHPQKLDNYCGKIHRIHDDGRIPDGNPFFNTPGAIPSIYSYGHRNPQGLVINQETGAIWANEHGPRGGDEMNVVKPGNNYGWPVISYGINYSGTKFTDITHKEGMEQPEHYWDPSIGVCGLDFVYSWQYPEWQGNALAGSLRFEYLARLVFENGQIVREEKLLEDIGRLRDVKMGKDGYVYVTVEEPGRVLRIIPER